VILKLRGRRCNIALDIQENWSFWLISCDIYWPQCSNPPRDVVQNFTTEIFIYKYILIASGYHLICKTINQ
jgi:hypothetical protein